MLVSRPSQHVFESASLRVRLRPVIPVEVTSSEAIWATNERIQTRSVLCYGTVPVAYGLVIGPDQDDTNPHVSV